MVTGGGLFNTGGAVYLGQGTNGGWNADGTNTGVFNPNLSSAGINTDIFWQPLGGATASTTRTPQVITTAGGVTAYPDKLSTTIQGILSGLALLTGAQHVPTTVSATQGQIATGGGAGSGLTAEQYAALLAQNRGNDGTAAGKVENWLKENTGVALIGGVVILAYFMKSPRGR